MKKALLFAGTTFASDSADKGKKKKCAKGKSCCSAKKEKACHKTDATTTKM